MRKLKHIAICFLFFLTLGTLSPTYAQAPTYTPPLPKDTTSSASNINALYGNVDQNVPKNLHTLTQNAIIEFLAGTVCTLSGHDPLNPTGMCLGFNPETKKIGYAPVGTTQGVAQLMGGFIGSTMDIPVSSSDYATYAFSNFGITKPAYAQEQTGSVGFTSMTPLIGIWSRFRDLAYLFFVLAFTVIGLAIMFRVKIDARTVMTIQNQIPKIVIALVMVTFSYAIAGFLIDMMYVTMYLILLTFSSLDPTAHVGTSSSIFTVVNRAFTPGSLTNIRHYEPGGGIINLSSQMAKGLSVTFAGMAGDFLDSAISGFFKTLFGPFQAISSIGCTAVGFLTNPLIGLGTLTGGLLGHVPGIGGLFGGGGSCNFLDTLFRGIVVSLFTIIVFLVVLIAILYTLFRVWFTLIKSFIYVLLDTIIGPLWIAAGIFPGSKLGFGTWVRHLAAHLSVFPMTFAVILLGKTIMDSVMAAKGQVFTPPLVGDAVAGNNFLAAIIGFGFILSIPTILDKTRKAIGAIDFGLVDVKKAFSAGNPLAAAQQGSQVGGTLFGLSHIPGVNKVPFIKNVSAGSHGTVNDNSVGGSSGGAH